MWSHVSRFQCSLTVCASAILKYPTVQFPTILYTCSFMLFTSNHRTQLIEKQSPHLLRSHQPIILLCIVTPSLHFKCDNMATTMRLFVSHHSPAPNFFQQYAVSSILYLYMISIALQNLVCLVVSPSPASLSRLLSAVCTVKQDLLVAKCSKFTTVAVQAEKVQDTKTVNQLFILCTNFST